MPRKSREYRALRDFDVTLRPGLVVAFRAGEILRGQPRTVIAKGTSTRAIEPVTKESSNG